MVELGFTFVLNPKNWTFPDWTVSSAEESENTLYGKGFSLWFFMFAVSFTYFDMNNAE